MKKTSLLLCSLTVIALFLSGCGEKLPPGMPKLYPTNVTLTYDDGKPLAGADVLFLSMDAASRDWVHAGTTNAEGKVEMMTYGKYAGVPAGKYKATVKKFVYEGEAPPTLNPMSAEERKALQDYMKAGKKQVRYLVVGKNYIDSKTTPIKDIEVTSGQNDITLKAGKEEKIPMQPHAL